MPTSLRAGGWGCSGGGARSVERPGGQLTRPVGPTPRVEESGCRLLESERRLQEERQRTAVLEQHLEKMRLEPGGGAAQRAAARSRAGRAGPEARGPVREAWRLVEEPVAAPWRSMWEAEASARAALRLPLLLRVLCPGPCQNRGPGCHRPAHLRARSISWQCPC